MGLYPTQFPVDLTGNATRNKVTGETRTFVNHSERIFVPSGGPFFTGSMRIVNTLTGIELTPVEQYSCLHLHSEATLDSGSQVCCVVIIRDITIAEVTMTYQVIGGQYSRVVETLISLMEDLDWETMGRISWGSQIYGKPDLFPAAAHRHPGGEFGDWKRFHLALNNIYQAMIHRDHGAWTSVYEYMRRTVANAIVIAVEQNKVDSDNYYTKQEVNDAISNGGGGGGISVSTQPGNQLIVKPDGVFYNSRLNVRTVNSNYVPTVAELNSNLLLRVNSPDPLTTVTISKVDAIVPIGTVINIRQIDKSVTIQGVTGVVISPSDSLDMRRAGITATLVYIGSNQWDLITELD